MKKIYSNVGTCIWCGKSAPEVKFKTAPHIVPESLGGSEIGFDVCDECNHYFGRSEGRGVPSVDLAFKEIFNCFKVFCGNMSPNSYKKLKSIFFEYRHKEQRVTIKRNFNPNSVTRQFKRGLYEVFLQKYHAVTEDGNNPMFDAVRRFARLNEGDLHVCYVFNTILLTSGEEHAADFSITQPLIDEMMEYGAFTFWMNGQVLYLEVFPELFKERRKEFFLKRKDDYIVHVTGQEGIFELTNVEQLDFLLCRFHNKKSNDYLALVREKTRIS